MMKQTYLEPLIVRSPCQLPNISRHLGIGRWLGRMIREWQRNRWGTALKRCKYETNKISKNRDMG